MAQAATAEKAQPYIPEQDPARKRLVRCIVHWANAEPENRDQPITVNDMGVANGRKVITPGKPVELSQVHINILKDSVEESRLTVPEGSGIYESGNPKQVAEAMNPGYQALVDSATGQIQLVKRTPNYVVERI